jgi:plastocyanin
MGMTSNRSPLLVTLAAVLALVAFGCSSDDTGVVLETGTLSESSAQSQQPEPTPEGGDQPSLDETFAHHNDSAAEVPADQSEPDAAREPELTDHVDELATDDDQADEPSGEEQGKGAVPVAMNEFGYVMDQAEFALGSTVTFEFTNEGEIEHEAMFGTPHEQEEFSADADHGGAGHHGDVVAITLGTGESGSLTITFEEPGEMVIGCHLPGHWEAGMATTLVVV